MGISKYMDDEFLGKEVQIYPGDTNKKKGIVRDINQAGVVFEITMSEARNYTVGKLHFISWAANLSFKLV
jgi:hypothetical protein